MLSCGLEGVSWGADCKELDGIVGEGPLCRHLMAAAIPPSMCPQASQRRPVHLRDLGCCWEDWHSINWPYMRLHVLRRPSPGAENPFALYHQLCVATISETEIYERACRGPTRIDSIEQYGFDERKDCRSEHYGCVFPGSSSMSRRTIVDPGLLKVSRRSTLRPASCIIQRLCL